jgi:hypothetical protein
MSKIPQFSARLPKVVVAALIGLAIITAFFVGKSVSDYSTPIPPAAASEPLDAVDGVAAVDASVGVNPDASNRAPRGEAVATNAAPAPATSSADRAPDPGMAEPPHPTAEDAPSPEIVELEPPPPETDGEEAF